MRFTLIVAASQDTAGQAFGFINVPHGFVSDPGFQRIKRKPSEAVMPCRFTVDIIRNIQAPSSASLAGFLFFDNGEHESIRCERTASDWGNSGQGPNILTVQPDCIHIPAATRKRIDTPSIFISRGLEENVRNSPDCSQRA